MIGALPAPLAALLVFSAKVLILLFWAFVFFLPGALLKILVPLPAVRLTTTRYLVGVGRAWTASNAWLYRCLLPPLHVELPAELDTQRSYLLICNHQSWADIVILFAILHGRTPWLRFFLKRELLWVPIIGAVCWALDFPFMKRHSRAAVTRNPALARDDLETTRRFCARFRDEPITVVNFPDGTRFSEAKRRTRQSPYQHLLRPKAAGLAFTLNAMGDQFAGLLDVTISYAPDRLLPTWSFLAGRQRALHIRVRCLPIEARWRSGDYSTDAAYRAEFQHWLNALWAEKDAWLSARLAEHPRAAP